MTTTLSSKPRIKNLPLGSIRLDGGTQPRVALDDRAINEYSEEIASGAKLPPATVFFDGDNYWLADGFHRHYGHERAGKKNMACEIYDGSLRDAILHSVGANATHGLRRTNADKRRAVETLLNDEEWSQRSDRWIAEMCGVSDRFVNGIRAETGANGSHLNGTVTGRDGKQYPAANNGYPTDENEDLEMQDDEEPNGNSGYFDDSDDTESEESQDDDLDDSDNSGDDGDNEQPPAPEPTVEEKIAALPLAQALDLYGHRGHIFGQQAMLWHDREKLIRAAHAALSSTRFTQGPVTDALRTLGNIPDPSLWEGCAHCKGSLRVGERADPCQNCKGGFTTHVGEGVSADVVREHFSSITEGES